MPPHPAKKYRGQSQPSLIPSARVCRWYIGGTSLRLVATARQAFRVTRAPGLPFPRLSLDEEDGRRLIQARQKVAQRMRPMLVCGPMSELVHFCQVLWKERRDVFA